MAFPDPRSRRRRSPRRGWLLAGLALPGVALSALAAAPEKLSPWVHHLDDIEVAAPRYRPTPGPLPVSGRSEYRFTWSGIPVGRAAVELSHAGAEADPTLAIQVSGATTPAIDLLWRYRFSARSVVRTDPFAPAGFAVDECENRRLKRTLIQFPGSTSAPARDTGRAEAPAEADRIRGFRLSKGYLKEITFRSDNTFDIGASLFLVLSLDYREGAHYAVDTFTGTSRYLVAIDVEARERLRRGEDHVDAWRLRVVTDDLTNGDPPDRHRETHVWVSAERPRRLLRARSTTNLGPITAELVEASTPLPPVTDGADRCV